MRSKSLLKVCHEDLVDSMLTAATNVHKELGPGLLESIYEKAMMLELSEMGIDAKNQVEVPVIYKGHDLGLGFRADIMISDCLLLEIKAVEKLTDIHLAQIMTYLQLSGIKHGYLLNFNRRLMKEGIKRVSI